MFYRLILLVLLVWQPLSVLRAAPAQQLFGDWQVTCNNQNVCSTRNVGLHHGLVMTLTRSAGASTLRIELGGPENRLPEIPAIVPRLMLDGEPLRLTGEHWRVSPWLLSTGDEQAINTLLSYIQEGRLLTLKQGAQSISLPGLKAALLFIDDQQKRVGSESAWIGKGHAPPLSVPPAPALKSGAKLREQPAAFSREEINNLLDYGISKINTTRCSLDLRRREMWIAPLTDERALLVQSCESGAWNTIYLAWLVSREQSGGSRPVHLRLPFVPPGSQARETELINLTFNEKSQELTTLYRGRRSGDCGFQTRWRFDGRQFNLVRYSAQPVCDNWQGPDAWPTLWITG